MPVFLSSSEATSAAASAEPQQVRRVLVVDDHPLFRQGVVQVINSQPGFEVCGECDSAPRALAFLRESKADAVLIDISLAGTNGIELTKQIRAEHPNTPILIVSMYDESMYAMRALRAGANGYIMKRTGVDGFIEALHTVMRGEIYVSQAFGKQLIYKAVLGRDSGGGSPLDVLSDRELEVLQLLGQGRSSQQIADDLHLSVKTVESHRLRMKEKLGFHSASELVRFALDWAAQQQAQ